MTFALFTLHQRKINLCTVDLLLATVLEEMNPGLRNSTERILMLHVHFSELF